MKYREIYDVLEKQQIDVPGFRFSDYSGWRSPWQSYMTLQRPLWIVAEDPASSRRLWITQDGRRKLRHSKAHIVPEPHSSGR